MKTAIGICSPATANGFTSTGETRFQKRSGIARKAYFPAQDQFAAVGHHLAAVIYPSAWTMEEVANIAYTVVGWLDAQPARASPWRNRRDGVKSSGVRPASRIALCVDSIEVRDLPPASTCEFTCSRNTAAFGRASGNKRCAISSLISNVWFLFRQVGIVGHFAVSGPLPFPGCHAQARICSGFSAHRTLWRYDCGFHKPVCPLT